MDMGAAFANLNWLAVFCSALSAFVIGGVWYSPLMFGNAWMKVAGMTEESVKQGNPGKIYGGAFLLTMVGSINLALFLADPKVDLAFGIAAGAATGIGWVAPAFGVVYLFEQRPTLHWFINGAYWVVSFIVMGAILGGWR